jgi:DNA-binding beta-propeller fold protein YncE
MSVSIDYTGGVFQANKAKSVGTITAGTGTYNLAVASYDSVSFSVASQVPVPASLYFRPDGLKLYVVDGSTNGDVYQYSLSTAWDITTISYDNINQSGIGESSPQGLFFKPDGTKMYITGFNSDAIKEINLSTAWDISNISVYQSFSVLSQTSTPTGIHFNYDGTLVFITGTGEDSVFKYSLSTAWNVSTASLSQTLDISAQESNPQDIFLSANGNKLFVTGQNGVVIDEYYLSTAYDLSTASHTTSFSTSSQENNLRAAFFKSDGTKMYVSGAANDTIYQYSTGTATSLNISSGTYFNYTPSANTTFTFANAPASGTAAGFALAVTGANAAAVYDIANASYDGVSFSVASQEANSQGLAFKSDGTKMYISGETSDAVYQYSLSTAWDVSTASYDNVSFDPTAQGAQPYCIRFKPDGTSLFIMQNQFDTIYQYTLSTAWDLSTASYASKSLSVSSQENNPNTFAFANSGTKLYVMGNANDTVFEYTLSTAYDVSTASYSNNSFSVASQDGLMFSLFVFEDGTKMLTGGFGTDAIYQYSLSTAYDVSTASYDSVSFSVSSQLPNLFDITFKPDGTKMYVVDSSNDRVYQYTTGSSATATFSYPASVEWPSGTAPTGPAIGQTDVLVFYTDDGGTTYQGFRAGDAMS